MSVLDYTQYGLDTLSRTRNPSANGIESGESRKREKETERQRDRETEREEREERRERPAGQRWDKGREICDAAQARAFKLDWKRRFNGKHDGSVRHTGSRNESGLSGIEAKSPGRRAAVT